MAKTEVRFNRDRDLTKREIECTEERKQSKHKRKTFGDYLANDEDLNSFDFFDKSKDIELDEDMKKYLRS